MLVNKKGIGPVVATALLLVVAVVAVVGFSSWFQTYNSNLSADVEQRSSNTEGVTIEYLGDDGTLYINNKGPSGIEMSSIKVGSNDCGLSATLDPGINKVDASSCFTNSDKSSIVIVTDSGIVDKELYTGKLDSSSMLKLGDFNNKTLVYDKNGIVLGTPYGPNLDFHDYEGYPYGLVIDSNNNVIMTGKRRKATSGNFYTVKYDKSGQILWENYFDSTQNSYEVIRDSSDNLYVVGLKINSDRDITIVKYSSSGTELFNTSFQKTNQDYGRGIALDSSNNIYAVGYGSNGVNNDMILVKFDSSGSYVWNRTFDKGNADEGYGVALDSLDNIYIVGHSFNGANNDISLVKYDSSGSQTWNRTFDRGNTENIFSHGISIDSSNNIYLTGQSSNGSLSQFILIKYESSGSEIWNVTFDDGASGRGYDLLIDNSDNIYVTGQSYLGLRNATTIKYDSSGSQIWNKTFNLDGNQNAGLSIAQDSNGNIFVGPNYDH